MLGTTTQPVNGLSFVASCPGAGPGHPLCVSVAARNIAKDTRKAARSAPASSFLPFKALRASSTRVTVAPITHTPPAKDGEAIETPPRVKQALGLDDDRSWIVLDEVSQFAWPGYDIRAVPGSKDRFTYGFIPPKLYDTIIGRILELAAARRVTEITRD